ncbi:MAG: hypothetical protein KatS3mg010_1396 [Acidimicrobiia bacterium]|nr:MAG: hypothetical protein KatS3mg010_1396 [Acidimicrobiia bacterium]
MSTGALTFARFAYPPNALGLCGPDAPRELLERADAAAADGGLRELALQFEGAWPYLELIAHAHGIADPLDVRVVEAYWIGNDLLDRIPPGAIGEDLVARFGPAAGRERRRIEALASAAPRPHHDFHVFCVYPWVGLLRSAAAELRAPRARPVPHPVGSGHRCRRRDRLGAVARARVGRPPARARHAP